MRIVALFLAVACVHPLLGAEPARSIRVIVALADNATQGIAPVPARIGNGDDADANLYWGCDEGFAPIFARSHAWKLTSRQKSPSPDILECRVYRSADGTAVLTAEAWRGSEIKQALTAFLATAGGAAPSADLVVFIGHNGLMDFDLPTTESAGNGADAIVLCCKSEQYFARRLAAAGTRPVLLTTQLMYPGSFILENVLTGWLRGESSTALRERAAKSYAANQQIRLPAARGVFSDLAAKAFPLRPHLRPAHPAKFPRSPVAPVSAAPDPATAARCSCPAVHLQTRSILPASSRSRFGI